MKKMKGITVCGDCGYYNWKKHCCSRGCKDEGAAQDHFYLDCPLPDAQPVVHCKDCKYCLKESEYEYWCNGFVPGRLVTPDDYCSHGTKTEDPHETYSV